MPIHRFPGGVVNADNVTPGANQASGVWTLESQLQANGTGFWPQSTSQMSRSLRFNRSDSAYLTRTPAVTGNRRTWTWSGWIKKSFIGSGTLELFLGSASTGGATIFTGIRFIDDQLYIQDVNTASYNIWWVTSAVFRDPSSWYHIVVKYDTTQASSANAVGLWINGISQTITFTAASGGYVQNREGYVNAINGQYLGINLTDTGALNTNYFSGYMTEVILVDGQALDPTYFGYTDSNNVWQPKPYSGSVGTNGFYLTFADNTGVTPTTLGKDYSNRGNNWTPVNFSVASGAGNDSLVDVPTNWGTDTGLGGEVRGNYATWNPISGYSITLTNGNLDYTTGTSANPVTSTWSLPTSGKWYWEVTVSSVGEAMIGIQTRNNLAYAGPKTAYYRQGGASNSIFIEGSANAYNASSYTNGDVIGVAYNADSSQISWYKNNVQQGGPYTLTSLENLTPIIIQASGSGSNSGSANFGQRPFAYTAPSGFKTLCTQNLPTPTIQNGALYFDAKLYTGNNGNPLTVSGFSFAPNLVWTKDRNRSGTNHLLGDIVRGTNNTLFSNNALAAYTDRGVDSFNSDGFTYSTSEGGDGNYLTDSYVAWCWAANGAGVTNTAGSITSTVSANTTSGFSIVTWTGNSTNSTVGHGLGAAPSMIIVKTRSNSNSWFVYQRNVGNTKYLKLNTTDGEVSFNLWQGTNPTSTVFYIATDPVVNQSGYTYVAYCFAPVAGYSAFGAYTGNGSTDGPFIYTGFRPRYIMVKISSTGGTTGDGWHILDTARNPYNVASVDLMANYDYSESDIGTTNYLFDFLSNGFKLRTSNGYVNLNAATFIYAAFAENPFKIARAR